jgi:flavin reductase (DIM6/NTAB) family NADH-FMN oxidoreductase RutF
LTNPEKRPEGRQDGAGGTDGRKMPVGPIPAGKDPNVYDRQRRKILWLVPNGLFVIGSRHGARRNLMTISWVTQVALDPKCVGVGVERGAVTRELISGGRCFALSVLSRDDRAVVRKFVKPVEDHQVDESSGEGTMNGVAVSASPCGAPVLAQAVAWIDCQLVHSLDLGSHWWFVGEVTDCGYGQALASHQSAGESNAGESNAAGESDEELGELEVLRMEDTRMNYGG